MRDGPIDELADLARQVQADDSVFAASESIAAAVLELVPSSTSVAVSLVHRHRRLHTEVATSEVASRGDQLQYDLGEGPCLDAAWEEPLVYSGDLLHDRRWPTWGPQVQRELGVNSMLCAQLFTNEDQLGALNVYSSHQGAYDTHDQEVLRLLAAHAAVAVASTRKIDNLSAAIERRSDIGKAIGILMVRYSVDDSQALEVLRRWSSHQNRKLHEVAADVVDSVRDGKRLRSGTSQEPVPPSFSVR